MLNTTLAPWPCFTEEEADAVQRVLLSNKVNYWTGDQCRKFESEFARLVCVKNAVALSNGTLALDAALKSIKVSTTDEVVVTPRTFIASVSSVINAGAKPVFADVDRNSGNITAETILPVLSSRTKAVICVHLAGWPCDMDPIISLAKEYNFKIIEDCAQSHGAQYKGRSVGSIGDLGAWSFCQDKIMSTGGEGGMITTDDEDLWRRIWSYKDHGKSYESVYERHHPPGFKWHHESFGSNLRMLELQAVIGRLQIKKLKHWIEARASNADKIRKTCSTYPSIRVPAFNDHNGTSVNAYYKCYVYVDRKNLAQAWSRDRIIDEINNYGIPCYQGTCSEVYLEKAFLNTSFEQKKRLAVARELGEDSLMFLVHPTLSDKDIQKTCEVLDKVLPNTCR